MRREPLPIPAAVMSDPRAVELLRVWAAHGGQHVSLDATVWNDPAAWGIMLVDLAKHVALAYHESTGKEFADVLNRIREGLDAEWTSETDRPTGRIYGSNTPSDKEATQGLRHTPLPRQ